MKRNKLKAPKVGRSLTWAIIVGVIAASLLSILLTALLTNFVLNGHLSEGSAGVIIFLVRVVSMLVGALIAAVIYKQQYLPLIGFTALGYLLVLLGTGIVFFDGSFKHFLSGVTSVLVGGIISLLILTRPKNKSRRAIKYNR